jgi:four helix bundle protein
LNNQAKFGGQQFLSLQIFQKAKRQTSKEFNQFLHIALGSAYELHTLITIAYNLGFIKEKVPIEGKLSRISKMLSGLIKSIYK